jgi:hypothetical protein
MLSAIFSSFPKSSSQLQRAHVFTKMNTISLEEKSFFSHLFSLDSIEDFKSM